MHRQQTDRSTEVHQPRSATLTVWNSGQQESVLDLDPARVTAIGRNPTCDVALHDSLCSRYHSEIFLSGDGWVIRDVGSRNGTFVDKQLVSGNFPLGNKSVIQVGGTVLSFGLDHPDPSDGVDTAYFLETFKENPQHIAAVDPAVSRAIDPAIVSEVASSRYRAGSKSDERLEDLTRGLTQLYQMAIDTADASGLRQLSLVVLKSMLEATRADIGAVLWLPECEQESPDVRQLQQLAFEARVPGEYKSVSASLSQRTIDEGRAVLAYYPDDDSNDEATPSDSMAEMHTRSVICAPIRRGATTCGLIHIYSTSVDVILEEDDLHLTLAAADHLGLVASGMAQRDDLAEQLQREKSTNKALRDALAFDSLLVGESESIRSLREEAHRIAPTEATVLIRGESGVGKELVARTIHRSSRRSEQSFVCLNCAALTESLLESELFGHEAGAFTGATEQKRGKFEQSDGGTLFLDEVGEMSMHIQSKFLRVLEGHPFERVGGSKPIDVNVRVVAATNRNLEEAVNEGQFRQDLYFRLQVVQLLIDPLRDRATDIPVLCDHFLARFAEKSGLPLKKLTRDAQDKLRKHIWPGNVRELQNTIERSLILSQGYRIQADEIRLSELKSSDSGVLLYSQTPQGNYRELSLERLEMEHILATLEYTGWNKSRASEILEIERSTLDRKLKRADVSRPKGDASE